MAVDEDRIRREIAGAVVRAPMAPTPPPPDFPLPEVPGPPLPVAAVPRLARPRSWSVAPVALGTIGVLVAMIGLIAFLTARHAVREIAGLIGLVIASVLIVGACIVEAIAHLRADLSRSRNSEEPE